MCACRIGPTRHRQNRQNPVSSVLSARLTERAALADQAYSIHDHVEQTEGGERQRGNQTGIAHGTRLVLLTAQPSIPANRHTTPHFPSRWLRRPSPLPRQRGHEQQTRKGEWMRWRRDMQSKTILTGRQYGLDWLRIGAFALLILYHIGMFLVPWGWHVKAAEPVAWAV